MVFFLKVVIVKNKKNNFFLRNDKTLKVSQLWGKNGKKKYLELLRRIIIEIFCKQSRFDINIWQSRHTAN